MLRRRKARNNQRTSSSRKYSVVTSVIRFVETPTCNYTCVSSCLLVFFRLHLQER
jgi:hypothetical protein